MLSLLRLAFLNGGIIRHADMASDTSISIGKAMSIISINLVMVSVGWSGLRTVLGC